MEIGLDGALVGLAHLVEHVADLVCPAALDGDGGKGGGQCRDEAAAAGDRSWRDHIVGNVVADREWFGAELQALDFEVSPSAANFVLTRPPEGVSAVALKAGLEARRILIRHFAKAPLDGWLRITIGTRDEMVRVLKAIQEVISA